MYTAIFRQHMWKRQRLLVLTEVDFFLVDSAFLYKHNFGTMSFFTTMRNIMAWLDVLRQKAMAPFPALSFFFGIVFCLKVMGKISNSNAVKA